MSAFKLDEYILSSKNTIQDAISKLDTITTKLILVASNKKLLGTVTDGDIRRALLAHFPLDTPLSKVMNTSPKVLTPEDHYSKAIKLKNTFDIPAVPKLDNKGNVIDLLGVKSIREKRDNAVFLMAGGFGKRLRPLTDKCPKPMLKVGEKPILENIIEQFIACGFYKFYISTHYLNHQIQTYFGNGEDKGIEISYINEEFPLGTAGAISLLPDEIKEQNIIMMNGDLLTQVKFDEMLDYHIHEKANISVAVRDYQIQVPFGVINHDNGDITNIKEKPIENYFINAGIYCISPEVLQSVKPNAPLDMPTLIEAELHNNQPVKMFPIHEYWLDIGQLHDYEQAQKDIVHLRSIA
jgi:dTDP-glucose pyrophosphorylase